jgi:hypothetical protein
MWSVDEVEELTFVIAPHKYMARYASTLNVTPEGGQECRAAARFRLESVFFFLTDWFGYRALSCSGKPSKPLQPPKPAPILQKPRVDQLALRALNGANAAAERLSDDALRLTAEQGNPKRCHFHCPA